MMSLEDKQVGIQQIINLKNLKEIIRNHFWMKIWITVKSIKILKLTKVKLIIVIYYL